MKTPRERGAAAPSFSQTMPSGNWFCRGLDLAGNLRLWANSPRSSWCNCLLSAFLITEYSSVTQASMQSFSLLYAAYGYVYQSRNNWRIDILFILFSNAVGLYFCEREIYFFFFHHMSNTAVRIIAIKLNWQSSASTAREVKRKKATGAWKCYH